MADDGHDRDNDDRTRIAGIASDADPDYGPVDVPESKAEQPSMPPYGDSNAPPPVPRPGTASGPTVPMGTLINNNYKITDVLKAGGMGEVYRGENVFTHDPVAIKLVKPDLAGDEKIALMFRREARTLGQLVDDAIVRYYNFVQDPQIDRYCLVMEFIEGFPLSELIERRGPLSSIEARGLMRRLAAGLGKAHQMQIVHRDLSPDNVMLPGGSIAGAKLIDFGIARSPLVTEGTMAGQFAGKFKFVSPEQLGHYDGQIGPATDIYCLGLMIAAAVRGEALPMGGSIVEAVEARRRVPDLSDVPADLQAILSHMLQPDPADRPASMAEVISMLGDAPLSRAASGLAPSFVQPTSASGLRLPPVAGMMTQQRPVGTRPPTVTAPPILEDRGDERRVVGLLVALFFAILGAAGWYGWTEGLIGSDGTTPVQSGDGPVPDAPRADTGPVTRAAFLATFGEGCALALRRSSGPMAGLVEGFGHGADWSALPDAYDAAFGGRPEVVARELTAAQCAVLDFARPMVGAEAGAMLDLALDGDAVDSGTALTGRLIDPLERPVWLALVTPDGAVWNISDRLSASVGDRRVLRVGLEQPPGAEAAGQLLIAVATPRPLASAAAAAPGTPAADLLPLVAAELDRRGGEAAVSLAHVTLSSPPGPDPGE
ncbi:serine/threonine-protein kinase [Jannaschia rubra]|uniref:Serine/threonine-protein kinase PrkC n=1 Tax=Jannaschia rubra TaxID=282197 RepID=A0A0M6XTQ4_9RHOB|nr:serine/threonine-protein kinase [Jannaschia rubra]CTQ33344.1 Serine/threonine-protein kinase PrkC [Jannaschia rubra]SFF99661.1 serine/threonine protein kinase [Jannaschia rubra]